MSLPQLSNPPSESFPTIPFSVPWLRSLRTALGQSGGHPVLMGRPTLPDWQIRHIEHLVSDLTARLSLGHTLPKQSHEREALAVILAGLLSAFPTQAMSDSPMNLRMVAYCEALADAPLWAVAEARLRLLRGEVTLGHGFCPSPPELANVVRMVLRPLRADLDCLRKILAAATSQDLKVVGRDRVATGWRKLKVDLSEVSHEAN